MKKSRRKSKKKSPSFKFFALFMVIALVTIVLLEYIDFKKTGKSFIFTKLIPLSSSSPTAQKSKPVIPSDSITFFNGRFRKILKANKIPFDYFEDNEQRHHFKLEIDEARFDGLMKKLKALTGKIKGKIDLSEIQGLTDKSIMLYKVRLKKTVTHLLLISKFVHVQAEPRKSPVKERDRVPIVQRPLPTGVTPRVAIIIDDIGAYEIGALELKRLGIPITASVLPDSRYAREAVHWLQEYNIETILHIPMQPTNHNGKKYDLREVITVSSTETQIRSLIRRVKQIVPTANGMNNHQGSLATSNSGVMNRLMRVIKSESLFFVDSRTIGSSVAFSTARDMGIRTTYRDVFIDHVQSYSHSMAQIRKLVMVAKQTGQAVAIGHPFSTTLRAIRDSVSFLKAQGVKVVPVSQLVR